MYHHYGKRFFDLTLTLLALLILSPVILLMALLVYLKPCPEERGIGRLAHSLPPAAPWLAWQALHPE